MSLMNGASTAACLAWPLPLDSSCAREARHHVSDAISVLGLDPALHDDARLAVDELASNVYRHVLSHVPPEGNRPDAPPELWVYTRGQGTDGQLVCKVFDPSPEWNGPQPEAWGATLTGWRTALAGDGQGYADPGDDLDLPESGRGLGLVHQVAAECGLHLTRSRLGGYTDWRAGKAVWFSLPIPDRPARAADLSADQAAIYLARDLLERGIRAGWRHSLDRAVVTIRTDLEVLCQQGMFSWTLPDGASHRLPYGDAVEVVERLVASYERMRIGQ